MDFDEIFTDAFECPNATFEKFSAVYATQIFSNSKLDITCLFLNFFYEIFTDALECPNASFEKFSAVYATQIFRNSKLVITHSFLEQLLLKFSEMQ